MTERIIERLGHLGDGIAPGPIYVPGALPGERVDWDGSVLRILEPVPDRVTAPCRHAKRCGACVVQHASDGFVADWKLGTVREALAARGLSAPLRRLHTSPSQSRRRATFSGKCTKSGALIGFHAKGSDTIVDVPECLVLTPALCQIMPALAPLLRAAGSRKGEVKIATTDGPEGIDLDIRSAKPLDDELRAQMVTLAADLDLARLTWEGEGRGHRHPTPTPPKLRRRCGRSATRRVLSGHTRRASRAHRQCP